MTGRGPAPGAAVALECLRAAGSTLLLPFRAAGFVLRRGRLRREVTDDLARPKGVVEQGDPLTPPERPLRIFVSCAEPSGELHGVHLVRALREELDRSGGRPPELSGLGGQRLAAEGVVTIGDPVRRAAMGAAVARSLGFHVRLLRDAAVHLRDRRPDLLIPIDSPALHVPLGRLAHAYGVPVVHFVTPQYWGWAPWRLAAWRRAVDLGLTILPFEPAWFARRGVPIAHVGHPLLDALVGVSPAPPPGGRAALALLPGSREGVIDRNLPWMIAAAARVRLALPELSVVLPHDRPELRGRIESHVEAAGAGGWIRIETGDLHASLARTRSALSVSGTILIDLLHHRIPAVVVYRVGHAGATWLSRRMLSVPWFASVNLLAGREVYPEFSFHGNGPLEEVADALVRCHGDEAWRRDCLADLEVAARRLGPPGACRRAACQALAHVLGSPAPVGTAP